MTRLVSVRPALLSVVLLGAIAGIAPASATITTLTYHLTLSDFVDSHGAAGSPVTAVDSIFSLSFNTKHDVGPTPLGSDLGLPSSYGQDLAYSFYAGLNILMIGQQVDIGSITFPDGGIGLYANNAVLNPAIIMFYLTTPGSDQYYARTSALTIVSAITATVPEPASWAMMLGGFGAIGGALRSRRRSAVSFG